MPSANPTFSNIIGLLDSLVPLKDPNIDDAPHQAFWRAPPGQPPLTRDQFVSIRTDDWGVEGPLVAPGNPNNSNLYLALSGMTPFDGSQVNQMPDTDRDSNARHATADELNTVATWIKNGALA
jgi:hypothetical protein